MAIAEVLRPWPKGGRATHYREQAEKLRDMAEAEPSSELRGQLLALAAEYNELAANLQKRLNRTGI